MKRSAILLSLICSVSFAVSGCQKPPAATPPAASPSTQAGSSAQAESKDKPVTPANGITQEEAGIKLRVDMPEIKPFLEKAKQGPIVPALKQNAVPQGLAYLEDKRWVLVSSYREDGKTSVISVIDAASGKMVKALELYKNETTPYTGHAGGISASKKHVWISSDKQVYYVDIDDIVKAESGGKVAFKGSVKSDTRASFNGYADGVLWIGEFAHGSDYPTDKSHYMNNREDKEHKAWIEGYKLNPETDLPVIPSDQGQPAPDYILSIPDRVQGMYMMKDHIWLSQSYGRNNASTLFRFKQSLAEAPHAKANVGNKEVPVWFLDKKNQKDSMELPPMSEGLYELNGEIHILFESGATKYKTSSSYALDRIQILPWSE
ncbi:hypothetical protein ACFQI7_26540 [Paenibacillus allorhizosphaerae]|uniref:Uncharacterized protein n=1 Tax=Paenibacillus allorhizosphaerae TaxID=2849866 RepID=A0ABN7TP54_9BACL|nr:hypothetical protein [Paenibacillus allorhizosphaerae]CAG7649459.1 hypothetical protein PAECIP111802_04494 [Paenibacillus allorhizosphaerae]